MYVCHFVRAIVLVRGSLRHQGFVFRNAFPGAQNRLGEITVIQAELSEINDIRTRDSVTPLQQSVSLAPQQFVIS